MVVVQSRCPRCKQFKPLFASPVRAVGVQTQAIGFLCLKCSNEVVLHKPAKVVEK